MTFRNILKGTAIAALIISAATGCKKETAQIAEDTMRYEAETLAADADLSYNKVEFTEGTETTEYSAENEGMPEAYTLVETDMDDAGFKRGLDKRFLACLKKLNLSDTQVYMTRKAFRAYEECKAADIRAHREAYAKLHARIEAARKELVAQLKNGKITREMFEKKMKALRADFEESLRKIKAGYAARLKACYEKFLRQMKSILTERQWKAFVDCYR